jgi:hypothetical protein
MTSAPFDPNAALLVVAMGLPWPLAPARNRLRAFKLARGMPR